MWQFCGKDAAAQAASLKTAVPDDRFILTMSQPPNRIAVVEDENNLRATLAYALRKEAYEVDTYPDGEAAWKSFESTLPDLVILDIIMPRMDGLELCRRIRSRSELLPVMFLTSKDEEFDRVLGLGLGADDYLCKPFSMRELIARVRVLLRRVRIFEERSAPSLAPADASVCEDEVRSGALSVDCAAHVARFDRQELRLTVTEFRMLEALTRHAGQVLSREQLMRRAYPEDVYVSDRAVDSHIKRLRQKLNSAGAPPETIDTVYGVGYRYVTS